jgi:galacturonosyltransferase
MPKKVLILANSSSGLYDFRNELILELRKKYQVSVSVPVESSDKDKCGALEKIGCQILPTDLDRRGLNPFVDGRLFLKYCGLLRREKSDLVITYTIKPNIYGALACRIRRKTCCVNITGLGTTFQKQGFLRQLVIWLYRMALKKVKVVFFENAANRQIFIDEKIIPEEKTVCLYGAGVNLERYYLSPYPKE